MDEAAYRQKFAEVVARPCVFEKALLTRCVACERAQRKQIAEREAVTCHTAASHSRCGELHGQLRHAFSFALGTLHDDTVLPHAKEMRVQCGGLKGLQQEMRGDAEVANVDGLAENALRQWGDWAEIPWSQVVHAAAQCYKGRHG
ncbi:MAG: hypothetical protein HZB95_02060 [Nitrosomonadales bacterium]|nr:hypothetical protein [Nitrosomonadales bacterium]